MALCIESEKEVAMNQNLSLGRLPNGMKNCILAALNFICFKNSKARDMIFCRGLLLCAILLGVGCAHRGGIAKNGTVTPFKKINISEPVELKLKAERNDVEENQFRSETIMNYYSNGQIIRSKEDKVDFIVESKTANVMGDNIFYEVKTVKKDGFVDLNELAFPELDQEYGITVKDNGEVLRAGTFPKTSIFYVPLISLPKQKVKVGDTWEMAHNWKSSGNHIPLKLELVSILKGYYNCYGSQCALIELSGVIRLDGDVKGLTYKSDIRGHIFFDMDNGRILWSATKNVEDLQGHLDKTAVESCFFSLLKKSHRNPIWQGPNFETCKGRDHDTMVPGVSL